MNTRPTLTTLTVCLLLWLVFICPAYAEPVALPYQAEVLVASVSPEDWQKAIPQALQQVLIKVSGNSQIMQNPIVRQATTKPTALVQSFNYVTNSPGQKGQLLQVRFSPRAINAILQKAQQPVLNTTSAITPNSVSAVAPAGTLQNIPSVRLNVSGIKGLQSYTDLYVYLHNLPGVMDVSTEQMHADQVSLLIKINASSADVNQQIMAGGRLIAQPSAASQPNILQYRWVAGPVTTTTPPAAAQGQPVSSTAAAPTNVAPNPGVTQPAVPAARKIAPVVEGAPAFTTPRATANSGAIGQSYAVSPDVRFTSGKSAKSPVPEEISPY